MTLMQMVVATNMSLWCLEEYMARAKRFTEDPDKAKRQKTSECRWCFYSSRIVGQVACQTECEICGKSIMNGSTDTYRLCDACAKKHSLCGHCGGDREMRVKRRKWPEGLDENNS